MNPFEAPDAAVVPSPVGGVVGGAAPRSLRLAAHWLDRAVWIVALVVPLVVWAAWADVPLERLSEDESAIGAGMVGLAIALAVSVAQWTLISATGGSLGKHVVGTRVVADDGSAPGFDRGVLRREWPMAGVELSLTCLGVVGLVPLIDGVFVLGARRLALHDRLAGTRVIVAPGRSALASRRVIFLGGSVVAAAINVSFVVFALATNEAGWMPALWWSAWGLVSAGELALCVRGLVTGRLLGWWALPAALGLVAGFLCCNVLAVAVELVAMAVALEGPVMDVARGAADEVVVTAGSRSGS